jgi:long-chain fatty acid transport protein
MQIGKLTATMTQRYAVPLILVTSGALLLLSAPMETQGAAFRILDQSASATGQGSAFTAQADDASAIYYNPAGMTQLRGIQISLGATFLGGSTSYTSPTGATTRGDFGGSATFPPPTNFYVTANLKDLGLTALGNLSVGIGVVTPFGTKYRYPENAGFNTGGSTNFVVTRESLEMIDIKPTVAYRLNDQLSFGLGADIYTFSGLFGQGQYEYHTLATGVGLPVTPGSRLELTGKDTAIGFNASMMYTPFRNSDGKPLVNVGFIYRSQATLHLEGDLRSNGGLISNSTLTLVLPQVYTAGIALWPVRDEDHEWKLEMDVDYTGWKSVRNNDIYLDGGSRIANPKNWRSGYTLMLGTEYKWLRPTVLPQWEIALRSGYWNSQTPVPDSSFSPTVPDADNHAISIGLGFLCKGSGLFFGLFECGGAGSKYRPKAVGIDLAYQALIYETRTVSGSNHFLTGSGAVDGRYETVYHVGAVNLRVNF